MKLEEFIEINPESISRDYPFDEIEYIDISSVGTGTLDKRRTIPRLGSPGRAKRIVRKNDILLATVRPNLRKFWFASNPKHNTIASTGFAILRAKSHADSRFIYYVVTNQLFTDYLTSNAKGAAYPAVDTGTIKRADVDIPSLPKQRKIASILSAYDILIDNNTRRLAILKEIAQKAYREWFVNFRFPGYENVKLVDSPLGQIPEGWEFISLASLMAIRGGSQPSKSAFVYEPTDGYTRLIQIRDYQTNKNITYVPTTNKLRTCDERDILIARYGASIGRICWGLTGGYNVALVKVIPEKPVYRLFLKSFLLSDFFQQSLIGMSGRAAQNGFNKGDIAAIILARPINDELLEQYSDACYPMESLILNLRKRNEILRLTRDLLLSNLVSGKLDVEDLDICASESVARIEEVIT